MDTTGTYDEALTRLHTTGPERLGRLTNHAPMAVEALAARGQAPAVHRWLDVYAAKLEEFPSAHARVTDANWTEALGDPRRAADWIAHFERLLSERAWRDVLAQWWPRLLPGMYGGSTHPVIRVGHAVRGLLEDDGSAPRLTELAHGLGYWAARHHLAPDAVPLPGAVSAAAALDSVPPLRVRDGGFPDRLARVTHLPAWAVAPGSPEEARAKLAELVRAAVRRYATHGHGEETMLVHASTAPNAVLRTLPALPRALWVPSLHAAWTASAAVTAMYAPDEPIAYRSRGAASLSPDEVFERAAAHGDEHVVKFADTALDVGGEQALSSALYAVEISEPLKAAP
ncbi:questin oxidase family protein [Streptomyces sp. NPDC091272]|uniref:questin oxidase family protein n=1 Tax=Streptomyces sp. NPDC091272 TaxID=3365981 RepID=UPI00381A5A6D